MRPRISIVVPFFNEEQNVAPLLAEIRAVCDGLGKPYDGSSSTMEAGTPRGGGSMK